MDLVHELCPVQLLEVTKKVTLGLADWPAYSIWLIYFASSNGFSLAIKPADSLKFRMMFSTLFSSFLKRDKYNIKFWLKF